MTTASTPSRTTRQSRGNPIAMALMSVFGFLIVVGYLTISFGRVSGEEFSPENFNRRRFTYWQLPIFKFQITPIDRQDSTNALERHLVDGNLVTEIKTPDDKRRWDLVIATTGSPPNEQVIGQGEARILCSYLDAGKDGSTWLEWTKKNPALAKVVWPIIAKLARQELYVFIPDLLVLARGANDPAKLQTQINDLLAKNYLDFAKTQQKLGQHAGAVELFTEAIVYAPKSAEAFSGRAESLTALGESAKASADVAEAQKLK